ncbi:hypothetical protein LSH36_595g03025 [Paralvinella palmiformis]|uniref:Fibrinogen C-terminal domain-containing protein n=1 Tax=Paralvinella palmiformis TaxID=53620 RepID=A0AAD9J542_9ANNE|nr:hypothetical protein LSH36_595g03025 [Paralvinella palmiformis]
MFPFKLQGVLRPLAVYSATFCCLLNAVGYACAERRTGNDESADAQCGGSETYYIHEYHVHTDGGTEDGAPTVVRPFSRPDPEQSSSVSYNRTLYMEEKTTWLERFRELSERLATERSRRVDMMARLVAWLSSAERSVPSRQARIQVNALKDMLVIWSDVEGWNYSRIAADRESATSEDLTSSQIGQDTEAEISARPCLTCNVSLMDDLRQVIADQKDELSETRNEIQKLHKRYLTTYAGYKKMVANVREVRRDLRSWEHRAGRLLRLYESQFDLNERGKVKESVARKKTDSGSLLDDIKALKRRVWCLERGEADPLLCPNVKSPKLVPSKEESASNDEHVSPKKVQPDEEVGHGGEDKEDEEGTVSIGNLIAANVTRLLEDSFVDAGKVLTEWHQDTVRRQRPKDCSEIDYWFQRREPVQIIYLAEGRRPVKTLCDEGWNVIMRNIPYGDKPLDWEEGVDRQWEHYKYGFGTFESDVFWFGNEYLYQLTNQADYQLRIDMIQTADDGKVFTEYAFFRVASEGEGYQLAVGDNMGTAGDVLGVHSPVPVDRQRFLTIDRHPDSMDNRLKFYRHGWWYPTVAIRHDPEGPPNPCFTHLTHNYPWICGRDGYQQLSSVIMKIRPLKDGL